jgi:integrase
MSPTLAEVLDELDRERKKLTSLHGAGLVFTRDGKPISKNALRKAFDAAKKQAKLKDSHFHDFRHCAVMRWTMAGFRKISVSLPRDTAADQCISDILIRPMSRWSPFPLKKWLDVATTL